MSEPPKSPEVSPPPAAPQRPPGWKTELVVLCAVALVVGLALRGLSLKPHGDFYGIWETGESLIHGELPTSFKRAPLYPLLVAGAGELLGAAGIGEVPGQLAAQWINALLLPLNVALVYLLGLRWAGPAGRWAAWWFLLLPLGMYCTTNELVEPLLITMILATLLAAQRHSNWAYFWAALATMTRYDAGGAIVGVCLAEALGGRAWRGPLGRTALAGAPLAIWLALTAGTWRTGSYGHYLAQLAERPQFELGWALALAHQTVTDVGRLRLPQLVAELEPYLRAALHAGLLLLLATGLVVGWRRQRPALIVAAVLYLGYTLVHAVFPFQLERFGYPMAPVYLLIAGLGLSVIAPHAALAPALRRAGGLVLVLAAVLSALTLVNELEAYRYLTSARYAWVVPLPAAILLGTATLWGLAGPSPRASLPRVVALLVLAVIGLAQLRSAVPRVAGGAEMENVVAAARWVRNEVGPEQRVLSATPGLLRLYAGREPTERFPGFEDIVAESWPEILAECRQRHIDYIIWYDQVFSELGDYYVAKCRLERFAHLSTPGQLAGIAVAQHYPAHPNVWILEILPADE